MNDQSFKTLCANHNAEWLADVLGFKCANGNGIDVYGEKHGIELKNRSRNWYPTWTIHAYQIDLFPEQNPGKELFWGFLLYDLNKTVRKIRRSDFPSVITDREIWLINWGWAKTRPVHYPKTGPYVYARQKYFPPDNSFSHIRKNGGLIHATKNSSLEDLL